MNILNVSTSDNGGAGVAAARLHFGLLNKNIQSSLLLNHKSNLNLTESYLLTQQPHSLNQQIINKIKNISKDFNIINLYRNYKKAQFIYRMRPKGLEMFSFPMAETNIMKSPLYHTADIINLHWVSNFLDWKCFFNKNTKPVVWTLHDQNPFLGGEHYAERFLGMDINGNPIQRKYSLTEEKVMKSIFDFKKRILQNVDNLHIVSPSSWLLNSSQNSELFSKYPHYLIPNGFPEDIYKPYDKDFSRHVLGLPQDKKIILFVSVSLENARKGFAFLLKALGNLKEKYNDDIILCSVGRKSALPTDNNNIELGYIVDERLMALAYSAADLFIIPSLEDNLPNTMIESLLCGTPVVGFPVGGIIDVIENNQNGYLTDNISALDLYKTITKALDNLSYFSRTEISKNAKNKYSINIQADNYIELYKRILA
jgi:glycosyltransferase involved in cell wall biosynthesis